jgi:hypothetical protein
LSVNWSTIVASGNKTDADDDDEDDDYDDNHNNNIYAGTTHA